MTTSVSLSDSLPRDQGGAKFTAWVDLSTSQLDFSLPAGIGSKTVGSKIVSALYSGNALAGSKIEPTGGVGNAVMVHFASAVSATQAQNGIHVRGDDRGQAYVASVGVTTCLAAGSTETFTTASGMLFRIYCAGCGVIAGGQVAIMNGATCLAQIVFSGANESVPMLDFGIHGTCFGSLRYERRGTIGNVYLSAQYRNFGQIV